LILNFELISFVNIMVCVIRSMSLKKKKKSFVGFSSFEFCESVRKIIL
jgi:hypothetical protein